MLLNTLAEDPAYVPSPPHVVETLYGEPYSMHGWKSPAEILQIDAERLQANNAAMADFPLHILDKPGKYVWNAMRSLAWRVSPTGPRVLDLLGIDPDKSWSMNRSGVVLALRDLGQERLAEKWVEYYLAAWDCYLAGFQDSGAGEQGAAIRAALDVITLGHAVCRVGCIEGCKPAWQNRKRRAFRPALPGGAMVPRVRLEFPTLRLTAGCSVAQASCPV